MTDNLGPLRQAMSDLAEHGGSTDMYERTLRRSRQSQRRTAVAVGGGAAAVVLAIGGAVALANTHRAAPSPPVATQAPSPSATPSPSTVTSSPTAPAATTTTPPSSAPHSSIRTSNRPQYPDCPSTKTLAKLADLPKDWHFIPSSVECWRTWATAESEGPEVGDGVYLFHYKASTGWRYHSQGSGYYCDELGITSGNPPFCQMD